MADRNAQIIISLRNQASPEIQKIAGDYRAFVTELQASGASIDQAERKMLSLAQAKARTLTASGQAARGEQELTAALGLLTTESTTAYSAQTQLIGIQQKGASAAEAEAAAQRQSMEAMRASVTPIQAATTNTNALTESLNDLKTAAGAIGVAFGVQQLIQFAKGAIDAANSLEQTESTVRALSGSQQRYIQVLAVARAGQQAYGGSLESNLAGLGSLVNLSNRAGVSLSQLDNISRRLAIVDPVQGIEGANIALKEFLAGNNAEAATSLARRFELPKQALASLAREGINAQQRLDGLNKLLNEQGITSQVLTDRLHTQAATYVQLGAAALNARDAIGALLAGQGAGAAGDATSALSGITQLISAYNQLTSAHKGVTQAVNDFINPIGAYNNFVFKTGANVLKWAGSLTEATPAADQLATAVAASVPTLEQQAALLAQSTTAQLAYATSLESTGLRARAAALANQQKSDSDTVAAVDAQTHAIAEQKLADQAQSAANALLKTGPAGARTAALLAGSSQQVDILTAAYYRLFSAQQAAAGADPQGLADQRAGERSGGSVRSESELRGITAASKANADYARGVQAAQNQLDLARAKSSAERIAILQREQAQTGDQAEKIRIQAQIESERNSGAKAHTSELGKQLTLQESIRDSIEKQLKAQLDAAAAAIKDRQDRRKEDRDIAAAQRILANPNQSAEFKAAAQDKIDLITIERQQRQLDIADKNATAGGTIVNGRLLQSVQRSGGAPVLPGSSPGPIGAPGVVPGGGSAAGAPGLPPIEVLVTLDGKAIAASVVVRLRQGQRQAAAAGGGNG